MTTDVTTQSVKEKVKLRVLPAIFILASMALIVGRLIIALANNPSPSRAAGFTLPLRTDDWPYSRMTATVAKKC